MAHAHQSNAKRIWMVFGILSVITTVEVVLGIYKPEPLFLTHVLGTSILNIIFIVLTVAKAYGIAWVFMHLEGEKKWFRRSIVWTVSFFIIYILFIVLNEGYYIHKVLSPLVRW